MHGYLASVASIYGAVWSLPRGAAPSTPPPPPPPPPPPAPPGACVDCQTACHGPPPLPRGASLCSNLTGRWAGSWSGSSYAYSVFESAGHAVSLCSDRKGDCWNTAAGPRKWDGTVHLTFHRCKPLPDLEQTFYLDPDCVSMATSTGNYTRLKDDRGP